MKKIDFKKLLLGESNTKVSNLDILWLLGIMGLIFILSPYAKTRIEKWDTGIPNIFLTFSISVIIIVYSLTMIYSRIRINHKQRILITLIDLTLIFPLALICGIVNFIYYRPMGSKGVLWGMPLISLYFIMVSIRKGIADFFQK